MIPAFLIDRFGPTLAKLIFWTAVAVIVLIALSMAKCSYDQSAKTQVKLSKNQTDAAIKSGQDAVETLGNATARETATHDTVKEGTDAIHNAPAGHSNDAADRAACQLRSYRHQPKCVALLGPAP